MCQRGPRTARWPKHRRPCGDALRRRPPQRRSPHAHALASGCVPRARTDFGPAAGNRGLPGVREVSHERRRDAVARDGAGAGADCPRCSVAPAARSRRRRRAGRLGAMDRCLRRRGRGRTGGGALGVPRRLLPPCMRRCRACAPTPAAPAVARRRRERRADRRRRRDRGACLGGGASISSSTRSCDQRSQECFRPTSSCGSPPRSTASGGARRARQPGWTRRRSSGRDEESPDFCPRKTCSDAYSIGWTTFRDGDGAWYAADSRRFTEACQVLQACIAIPLVLLFVSAGWRAFLPEEVECRLNVGWAQVGVPSISCSGRCPTGICQDQHLEWTDPAGFDHVVSMCGCGDDLPRVACQGWVEVIYSNPIEIDGGCLWPEGCILQECVALPLGNWPMRPALRVPACECQ